MDNSNAMFAPMKKLGFPALDLVKERARNVIKLYAEIQTTLQISSGYGLNPRQYEPSASTSKKKQMKIKAPIVQEEGPESFRAEKWNLPGMSSYGYYITDVHRPTSHPAAPSPDNQFRRMAPVWPPPMLSVEDRDHLLELYYTHVHPQMPLLDQVTMQYHLNHCWCGSYSNSYFSPLFFCAMFANVVRYSDRPHVQSQADQFMGLAHAYRESYYGHSSISSILALILMAEAEQTKQQPHVAYAWLLAGESIRMTMELGLQRSCNVSHSPADRELAVRTFWAVFTTDRLMAMTYGRPFLFEEKDIEMPMPSLTDSEKKNFPHTKQYLKNFATLIDISKVVGRIIRFNYSAQAVPMKGPSLHQEAMLSTLNSWIASMIKEAMNCPPPANAFQSHFETMKRLMLHTLLILLHQPHVDTKESNVQKKNGISMPSFEITTYSALIITERISELSLQELEYMIKCSPAIYTLLTAMRVHLMNASYEHDDENVRNGEISFLRSIAVIEKAQQYFQEGILLSTTISHLQNQFFSRSCSVLAEYADKIKHGSAFSSTPIFDGYDPTPSSLMNSAVPGSSVLIPSEYRGQPPKTTRAGLSRTNKNKSSRLFTSYKPDAKGKLTAHRQLQSKPSSKKKCTFRNTEAHAQSSSSTEPVLQQDVSPGNLYASPMEAYHSGEPSSQNYYTFVEQQLEPAQQCPQQQQMASPSLAQQQMASPSLAQQQMASPSLAQQQMVSPGLAQQQMVSPGLAQQQMVSPGLAQQQMVSPGLGHQQMVSSSLAQQHGSQFTQPSDIYQDPTLAFLHQITQSMEQYGFYASEPAPGIEMPPFIPTSTYNVTPNSMVDNIDTLRTYIVDPSSSQIQITDGNTNTEASIIDPNMMLDLNMYNYGGSTSSA